MYECNAETLVLCKHFREVSERWGLPDLVLATMYSTTTPREVTVVDGVQLIIASPPVREHRNADGSAHMWRPSASYSACTFIFDTVVTRRGLQCSLHKSLRRVSDRDSAAGCAFRVASSCRSLHVWVTDPMDARRRFYFGKIQIWNGWYSRLESELRRLTPFLDLDCACALSPLPVPDELPWGRVARYHTVFAKGGCRVVVTFLEIYFPKDGAVPSVITLTVSSREWSHRAEHYKEERRHIALREFRASLLPIVFEVIWNVKKYGAARLCLRDINI